ncbi:MAG: hypothetical protein K0R19_2686 [Bacillota bacterium]|jgi:hypothetical protein|nr:hypothetical protein [Bacillota bacterium]
MKWKNLQSKMESLVPAGIDLQQELKWIRILLTASFLYSFIFLLALSNAYQGLFIYVAKKKVLMDGAIMPDFVKLLGNSLAGFLITVLSMIGILLYHYLYHFQGSKSIYLMKRLPDRWELWKRCLSLPILAALVSFCIAAVLLIVYFGIYLLITPEICLLPNQWEKIWEAFFKAGRHI